MPTLSWRWWNIRYVTFACRFDSTRTAFSFSSISFLSLPQSTWFLHYQIIRKYFKNLKETITSQSFWRTDTRIKVGWLEIDADSSPSPPRSSSCSWAESTSRGRWGRSCTGRVRERLPEGATGSGSGLGHAWWAAPVAELAPDFLFLLFSCPN